jgi:environmental stress-induced protein Ves
MSWQRLSLQEATSQTWRNGGGVTHEFATWPSPDHWQWRVSVARIDRDGPFSAFEGIQRWFAVLTGDGVKLSWPTHAVALTPQSDPVQFAGSPACDAHLLGGPTLDFNLMTRGLRGHLTRQSDVSASVHTAASWPAQAHVGIFACTDCVWQCDGAVVEQAQHSLHWTHLATPTSWSWTRGDALIFVLHAETTP